MSKYTLQKNEYSIDIIRNSDNHACSFMCSDVLPDPDLLYVDKQTDAFGNTIEADELPEGKNFGDVKVPGKGLTVSAIASDGVIEGIEDHTKKFCHGVQWHPEFLIKSSDKRIFQSFIKASY